MTNYDGVLDNHYLVNFLDNSLYTDFIVPTNLEIGTKQGIYSHGSPIWSHFHTFSGIFDTATGRYRIFDHVWIRPLSINLGIISSTQIYEIQFWNSYIFDTKSIFEVPIINGAGTTMSYTLPIVLTPNSEELYTLIISKDGPPSQNTSYTFKVFAEADYILEITGLRILPITVDIDWASNFKVKYLYNSVITRSELNSEQRFYLSKNPIRSFTIDFLQIDDLKLLHTLKKGSTTAFGIPIYSEDIIPSGNIVIGAMSIATSIDLSKYFNIYFLVDTTTAILVKKISDPYYYEIKQISSVSTNLISVKSSFTKAFNASDCIIYPLCFVTMSSHKSGLITDNVYKSSLEFKEFFLG